MRYQTIYEDYWKVIDTAMDNRVICRSSESDDATLVANALNFNDNPGYYDYYYYMEP